MKHRIHRNYIRSVKLFKDNNELHPINIAPVSVFFEELKELKSRDYKEMQLINIQPIYVTSEESKFEKSKYITLFKSLNI